MITKLFHLNTSHVSKETAAMLDEQSRISAACRSIDDKFPRLYVAGFPYGWFMYADEESNQQADVFTPDLVTIMKYVRSQGCEYFVLDCDTDVVPELPTYDW